MKKNYILIGFMCAFAFSTAFLFGAGDKPQKDSQVIQMNSIVEDVTVTNVEVPVRVLFEGMPVSDLSRNDFALFENKKKMDINGFILKRKKIELTAAGEIDTIGGVFPPRTFVLVFRINEYNDHIEKAVEHLIDNVFRPIDHVLVFANDKTYEYTNLKDKDLVKKHLIPFLKMESHRQRQEVLTYVTKIEALLDPTDFQTVLNHGYKLSVRIHNFLKEYNRTWKDFKRKFLSPKIDQFYYFSRYLENIKGEKWVLNFYQFEMFPNIRFTNKFAIYLRNTLDSFYLSKDYGDQAIAQLCDELLNEIMGEMTVSKTFPIEEVSKLFYKVNATFHSFFINTIKKGSPNEMNYAEVASDIEKTLKRITYFTGGKNITSNDLVDSIDAITEVEDIYYILSYVPQNSKKAGKIEVVVREPENKEYQVLYDDNFNADYINDYFKAKEKDIRLPEIKVDNFSFKGKMLVFTVKNYQMRNEEKNTVGHMKIRIKVVNKDGNSEIFDQQKTLTARKEEMKITIPAFKSMKSGEYNFIINAEDLLTGKEDVFHQSISVR